MQSIGLQGILTILSHLFFIWISFNALQSVDLNKFFKKGDPRKAQIVYLFLGIALGYTVSSFFISLITASQNLQFLF
ncbi:DUF1146 family protein [Lactobacillus sp. YT155]|uniref:DUF1146 family protein n=1 Tax=Lactobacillus sp. YT155 TaxID=3060955 RepID=UPI0026601BBF|nr:DUF1146 family protein [Lactobacillus sp. YT155]MDO1604991.1 DUF1146 family protein [Lactobacillus sp. YT155]